MIELFARWSAPCNPVTQPPAQGLQKLDNDSAAVTRVTLVTQKKQQPNSASAPRPTDDAALSKNGVTRVTRVTRRKSLDNSCNPTPGARVTGLQTALMAEATSWPAPVQRAAVRLAGHLERRGASWGEAMARAVASVRALHIRRGSWPRLWTEPGLDLAGWPAEARQEVEARAARLQAGGWAPPKARTLAAYITAGRRGLQLPGRVKATVAGVVSEATAGSTVH